MFLCSDNAAEQREAFVSPVGWDVEMDAPVETLDWDEVYDELADIVYSIDIYGDFRT